jgi:hypothetical protein
MAQEIWSLSQTVKALHYQISFLGGDVGGGLGGVDGLGGSVSAGGLWGVDGGTLVLDVGDETVGGIGVVGDNLASMYKTFFFSFATGAPDK